MPLPQFLLAMACLGVVAMAHAADPPYDPLVVESPPHLPAPLDLDVIDDARERTIPVRVWLPSHDRPAPVILFSHGLGGARDGSRLTVPFRDNITEAEILAELDTVFAAYATDRKAGESLGDFVRRVGIVADIRSGQQFSAEVRRLTTA